MEYNEYPLCRLSEAEKAERLAIYKALRLRRKEQHYMSKYCKKRRDSDPVFRLKMNLRVRINAALKRKMPGKESLTCKLLGCEAGFFKSFLEHQFINGMNWDNYGSYWHIDHIIPISYFDLSKVENQKLAFHYSNCRPLEKLKNVSKQDSMPGPHQALLI